MLTCSYSAICNPGDKTGNPVYPAVIDILLQHPQNTCIQPGLLLSECSEARITHLHTLIGIPVTQFRPQACHMNQKIDTWGCIDIRRPHAEWQGVGESVRESVRGCRLHLKWFFRAEPSARNLERWQ